MNHLISDNDYSSPKSRAWAEISKKALAHNVQYLQSLLPGRCALMPVVKANAYGHGSGLIAKELHSLGIRSYCVACLSEGVELRQQGITGEILLLGYTHPDQFPLLAEYGLTQTVVDHAYAQALSAYACSDPGKPFALPVQIAVDTGMRRLGESADHIEQIREMFTLPGLHVTGMYTHLAASDTLDEASKAFTRRQIDAFYRLTSELAACGIPRPRLHLQASYGILHYPLKDVDYARPGIALYGLLSSGADTKRYQDRLQPVLSLRARVASIHRLSPGESAGYGMAYTAEGPTTIAAITIGYADGLPRSLSAGKGRVLLHGQSVPIIGRICMDQLLADVTSLPRVQPGDIATLIGSDGPWSISAADLADACATITNELLSCLGSRLERVLTP